MILPRFLFWNLEGKNLQHLVAQLAEEHLVDLIVLSECKTPSATVLMQLNARHVRYELCPGLCESITIFGAFQSGFLTPILESARISIRRLALPARQEILVASAHLPSRLHFSDESMIFECANLARMIAESEEATGHGRTILLGDLNVNPFETGMVGTGGLHAVMSRDVASRGSRTVQSREYDFFYNPMWGHLGDRKGGVPGTYYYDKAEHVTYFWNMFDQVLVRPSLLEGLGMDGVRVLTSVQGVSLLGGGGRPNRSLGSDHLPVLAELNF
jgi:endonuclease/exonuclease/phosphatase (EEP) superfamily protein YafD